MVQPTKLTLPHGIYSMVIHDTFHGKRHGLSYGRPHGACSLAHSVKRNRPWGMPWYMFMEHSLYGRSHALFHGEHADRRTDRIYIQFTYGRARERAGIRTSRKGTADAPGTRERASIMMAEEQVGKKQHSSGGGNSVRNSRRTTVNQIMQQQQ